MSQVDSGENVTFLDTSYISFGMTKANSEQQQVALEYVYSKQHHTVLAYVQQAVSGSKEQCSKQQQQQQQQHKQPYSYLKQALAPHNNYFCMQFSSSSSSTLHLYCRI